MARIELSCSLERTNVNHHCSGLGPDRISAPESAGHLISKMIQEVRQLAGADTCGLWIARSRQRRALFELGELNDALLKDIGVSQDEALREGAKRFWQQ